MKVVVVGGGLAGLATALESLDKGYAVELIERHHAVGGALGLRTDADGDSLESSIHWYSRGDSATMALFERAGITDHLRWVERSIAFARPGGATSHIPLPQLPSSLSLLTALANNDLMTPAEKILIVSRLAHLVAPHNSQSLDHVTYARWYYDQHLPPRVLQKCFDPIARAITWLPADQVSAQVVITLLHQLATHKDAGQLGTLDGPTASRLITPIAERFTEHGGKLRTNCAAQALVFDSNGVAGVHVDGGETIRGDAYVLAIAPSDVRQLLPANLQGIASFADLTRLRFTPTINVQLWFDRYVHYGERFYLTADACFSAFGDLALTSPIAYDRHKGSLVALSVAPATPFWQLADGEIVARCRSDLQRLWPGVRQAKLLKSAVVRHSDGVIQATPGMNRYRPDGHTPFRSLFLAGDWTAPGAVSSLANAVASARRAARCVDKYLTEKQAAF